MIMGAAAAAPQVRARKLRALAVTSLKRLPDPPDLPDLPDVPSDLSSAKAVEEVPIAFSHPSMTSAANGRGLSGQDEFSAKYLFRISMTTRAALPVSRTKGRI